MGNEIYNFLKQNNLTQKDEATFLKEYSTPEKVNELYGFMQQNNLTQKSAEEFAATYFPTPAQKKSPSGTTSTSSATPVQQPTKVSAPLGQRNLLQEAEQLFGEQGKQEEQFQQGINPEAGKYFERKREETKLSDKVQQVNKIQYDAAQQAKAIEENSQYPVIQQMEQLLAEGNAVGAKGGDVTPYMNKIKELSALPVTEDWRKPTRIQTAENNFYEVPNMKKSAYKTYGEMFEATSQSKKSLEQLKQQNNALQSEITPEIEKFRQSAEYIQDGEDAQGNKYMKLNPMQAFVNGFEGSVSAIELGLQKMNPLVSDEQIKDQLKLKYLRENVLFPKQADGYVAKGAEMLGGVSPLIAGGLVAPQGMGALAMNALGFGAMDLGGGLYEGFVEGKQQGMSDDDAMEFANKIGMEKGATGVVLGATMPIQGAVGRKMFLSAEGANAFKTMLAEQGAMVPSFMTKTYIDNLAAQGFGSERVATEGVAESGISAFILAGMTHAIGAVPNLSAKTKEVFENTLAKNYESLGGVFNQGVQEGVFDYATNQRILEKAKAFETIGKDLSPKQEAEQLPIQMEIDRLTLQNKDKKGAIVEENEAKIKQLNRELKEKRGSPLTPEEQKEYEAIKQKAETTDAEGKKQELLPTEKQQLEHFEKRIEQAGKNEANKIAQEQGFDSATHLLNSIKKAGLGEFDKVQDVPRETLDKLKEKRNKYQAGDVVELEPTGTEQKIEVEPDKGYSFTYESENDIPSELRGIEPIIKGDINGKPRLTFSGKQLIKAGLAKESKQRTDVETTKPATDGEVTQTGVRPDEIAENKLTNNTFENAKEGDLIVFDGNKWKVVRKGKSRGGNDIIEISRETIDEETGYVRNQSITIDAEQWGNEVKPTGENSPKSKKIKNKSDSDIEKRMLEIENSEWDSDRQKEFFDLEKEMERRERESVFNVPIEEAGRAIDILIEKDKTQPNGYGSFVDIKDAKKTKLIIEKYTNKRNSITDEEIKADFKEALMGRPDTQYSDGMKLRESSKLAGERGISIGDLVKDVKDVFLKDGYDLSIAEEMVNYYLRKVFGKTEPVAEETTVLREGEKPVAEEIAVETIKPEVKDSFAKITDLFYKIREATGSSKKRSLKEQRDKILEENPSIKYIDDNISAVMKQLEDKGLITKKGDCP